MDVSGADFIYMGAGTENRQNNWPKSMSHSQLVSPVKYFRLMASTITSTSQGDLLAAI